ncbi:MAG TPA: TIR domain-containing protein, partial [Chthoniobacteraceae bacterium]|nr:TIR domain-containing protein [Chthoniobacteraceae bacterium]
RAIAVLSADYLSAKYVRSEWQKYFADDPTGADRKLVPVRVGECKVDGLLAQIIHADLVGLSEVEAKAKLLSAAAGERGKPATEPSFPGDRSAASAPPFPGFVAQVGAVPLPREHLFGRDELLFRLETEMRARLGRRGLCLTGVAGMGGVGKTELALVLAQRLADVCPDRQFLIELLGTSAAPLTPAAVLEKILRAFHPEAQLPEDVPALRRLLEQTLRDAVPTGCLLILDNARDAA